MSTEIVYDRAFLKTTTGIIPLILIGSSNTTEFIYSKGGALRERLERHWSYLWEDQTLGMPAEELLGFVAQKCAAAEGQQFFRINAKQEWITSENCLAWYRKGINAASSIEHTLMMNPGVSLKGYIHGYKKGSFSNDFSELSSFIHTTKELEDWLVSARERKKQLLTNKDIEGVFICLKFSDNNPLHSGKLPDGPVIAKQRGRKGGYVTSYIPKRSCSFTQDQSQAHVFESAEAALLELGTSFNICFLKANPQNMIPNRYVLRFVSGRFANKYVYGTSAGRLQATPYRKSAKMFKRQCEAKKYALQIYNYYSAYQGGLVIEDLQTNLHIGI